MKTHQLVAAAALSLVALASQAENYDGVHAFVSTASRDSVNAEAVRAASAPNQNVTRGSRGADPFNSVADPATVRAQAIAAASAPDQNVSSGSRVNSRVISTMNRVEPSVQAQQGSTSAK